MQKKNQWLQDVLQKIKEDEKASKIKFIGYLNCMSNYILQNWFHHLSSFLALFSFKMDFVCYYLFFNLSKIIKNLIQLRKLLLLHYQRRIKVH